MNQEEYDKLFETQQPSSKMLSAAFEQVSDIRKFEIELYWKRATYFWALIAVAFAGYFAVLSADEIPNRLFLSLIVACVGLVFTFAWHLANLGSKYWQENWENHLDLLEDQVTGPLYKTLLERPGYLNKSEKYVTGPLAVSVSKINQWVSVFVLFSWMTLICFSAYKSLAPLGLTLQQAFIISAHVVVVASAVACCFLMRVRGSTHTGEHNPVPVTRITRIRTDKASQ